MDEAIVIGVHPDKTGNESYSEKMVEFLRKKGVKIKILNLLAPDGLEQALECDGIMWRWTHNPHHKQSAKLILSVIESQFHIPVYPDTPSSWHYDEKVAQHYLLQSMKAPTPKSWVFWDREEALQWAENANYPIIWKLSSGAGASNVLKLQNKNEAEYMIKRAFAYGIFPYTMNEFKSHSVPFSLHELKGFLKRMSKAIPYVLMNEYPPLNMTWWKPEFGYAYFQEFLPNNEYDTRITIIGNRAYGRIRMNRPNDFRASGSGVTNYDPGLIDKQCIKTAFEVSAEGKFQSMSYDFLYKNKDPVISEISYTCLNTGVHNCPGHWDFNLNWIEGPMWPEEAIAEDFLSRVIQQKKSKM
jgi:glutathione synthase/RimK-type ligase-like ATP-grasp enzyme